MQSSCSSWLIQQPTKDPEPKSLRVIDTNPIINLRKQTKTQENAKLTDEDDFDKDTFSHEEPVENHATPSLFQKKLGKILHKLKFLSAVRNEIVNRRNGDDNENAKHDQEIAKPNLESQNHDQENNEYSNKNNENRQTNDDKEGQSRQSKDLKSDVNDAESKDYSILEDALLNATANQRETDNKQNPVTILEVLGTFVGLAYGAAAQIINRNATNAQI